VSPTSSQSPSSQGVDIADPAPDGSAAEREHLAWLLTVCGGLGLAAALILTVEKIALLADPSYRPSCSINPVISCGSIMTSWQAELFGFPNPLLGIAGFSVLATTGVVLLAGAVPTGWYWDAVFIGLTAAVVFVHWLIFQSLYRIGALCPYCTLVWLVTVLAWWYCLLQRETADPARPGRWRPLLRRHHAVPPTMWVLTVLALITEAFWPYWRTLL